MKGVLVLGISIMALIGAEVNLCGTPARCRDPAIDFALCPIRN